MYAARMWVVWCMVGGRTYASKRRRRRRRQWRHMHERLTDCWLWLVGWLVGWLIDFLTGSVRWMEERMDRCTALHWLAWSGSSMHVARYVSMSNRSTIRQPTTLPCVYRVGGVGWNGMDSGWHGTKWTWMIFRDACMHTWHRDGRQ
ncbi:hypothetical protein IWX49DRAFT_586161 [Phyllosticta citricarpa]